MPKENGLELKVGAFVALALVCLIGFVFSISDFSFLDNGDEYSVLFSYANGLKKGAPVRLAGVDAGHVKNLVVFYDKSELRTKVKVGLWVNRGTSIPMDSTILINQLGLLGEKYVEILPGKTNIPLGLGAVTRGEDPIAMETIMAQVGSISAKIDTAIAALNQKILTEDNAKSFASTLQNISAITASVKNGDGSVGKLFADQALYQNLSATLANIAVLTNKMKNGEGSVGKLMSENGLYQNLEELSLDLKRNPWKLFYKAKEK